MEQSLKWTVYAPFLAFRSRENTLTPTPWDGHETQSAAIVLSPNPPILNDIHLSIYWSHTVGRKIHGQNSLEDNLRTVIKSLKLHVSFDFKIQNF